MILLTHIAVGILSTWGLTELYSHESIVSIKKKSIQNPNRTLLTKLLSCPFCMSYWIALLVSILITYFHHNIILTFLYWMIFVRVANLLNDITYNYSRSPLKSYEVVIPDLSRVDDNKTSELSGSIHVNP